MTSDLEKRIRMVYPTGMLNNPNKTKLLGKKFEKQVFDAVREISESTSADCVPFPHWWDVSMTHEFHFTLYGPRYDYYLNYPEAILWMKENHRDYIVLELNISKVYPAYEFCFLIWKYIYKTGFVESYESSGLLDTNWVPFCHEIIARLKQRGIIKLKEHELKEKVPFVMVESWYNITDDDRLPFVPATVHQCLFEEF